jgi:hypothetical protein
VYVRLTKAFISNVRFIEQIGYVYRNESFELPEPQTSSLIAKTLLPNLAASTCSTPLYIFIHDLHKDAGRT